MADINKMITDLGNTDWGENNESQMKAVQLLKGLALSEDPISNKFMKALSDASTNIAKSVLSKTENVEVKKDVFESIVEKSSKLLEETEGMEPPLLKTTPSIQRAMDLLF